MKRIIITLFALVGLVFAGCHKESITSIDTNGTLGTPNGSVDAPLWSVDTNYDYSSSMTAVVEVELSLTYSQAANNWHVDSSDMVGAFCGDKCVGVAKPTHNLFFVYIIAPEVGSTEPITLRYYSSILKNIFYSDVSFPFVNGGQQGTVNQPLRPQFRTNE